MQHIVIKLDSFHIALNFMRVIGQHMCKSGLEEVLSDSGVFGEATASNIMLGKSYNRTVRTHKLTFEALMGVMWPLLQQWADDHDRVLTNSDTMQSVTSMCEALQCRRYNTEYLAACFNNLVINLNTSNVLKLFTEFDLDLPLTSEYWRQYMSMVSILLEFVIAEREGNWDLHLSAFEAMFPWFSAYNHTNYTHWGAVYLADMKLLPDTHCDIHQRFVSGNFVVQNLKVHTTKCLRIKHWNI